MKELSVFPRLAARISREFKHRNNASLSPLILCRSQAKGLFLSHRVWQRGDIVVASFDPTPGQEQQGRRPAIVVTHADLNRLGMIGVCPITQGGMGARNAGLSVNLMGTGMQTQGVVLVHQFRMMDPSQRALTLIEQAPDDVVEEVRARVAALLD